MSRFAVCLLVLSTLGLTHAEEPKKEWVKIAPEKQKYAVEFPTKPTEQMDQKRGSTIYLMQVKREGGNGLLMLHILDFPEEIDLSQVDQVKTIMDKFRDGVKKQFPNPKILSDKGVKFNNKHPERDLDIEQAKIGIYRTRIILTPKAMYNIAVAGPKDFVNSADAKKFLDSFN